MRYAMKYSFEIPYYGGLKSKAESSKINSFISAGVNTMLGGGTIMPKINDYVETGEDTLTGGMVYDFDEMGKDDNQLKDGDLLPEWIYFWLKLCKGIQILADEDGIGSALLALGEKELCELDGHVLCSRIGSNLWTMGDYGVILLWGADEPSYSRSFSFRTGRFVKKLRFPVRCRGAIFSMADGCGVGWRLNAEDGKRIGLPGELLCPLQPSKFD
jgi:hypothetical protein